MGTFPSLQDASLHQLGLEPRRPVQPQNYNHKCTPTTSQASFPSQARNTSTVRHGSELPEEGCLYQKCVETVHDSLPNGAKTVPIGWGPVYSLPEVHFQLALGKCPQLQASASQSKKQRQEMKK
ncbi:hypothetical protein P7K49_009623 [Saguinus oedipus]|uniref:Uncharacterized protein n=1 Tax=Saguinus oedipus TaxID=9490 RepID=A0ABQ9VKH6_SAGOE|nr:hypothetical protein P7K49_009623 [Saguinus oedipus]